MTEMGTPGQPEPKKLWERSFIAFVLGVVVAAVIGTVGALNWLEGFVDKRIQSASVEGPPGPEGPTGPQGEAGPRGKNGDPSQFHLEDLLHGAVVAFDRSEDRSAQADTVNAGACPPGW